MKQLIVIAGPTAIGKTAVAIDVARQLHTEIISFDSRQFYKELNIGVARPTDEELSSVKHHFIANRSVTNPYNFSSYEHEALRVVDELLDKYGVAVAVGGSGMYMQALTQGINTMPDPSPELRRKLKEKIAREGLEPLLQELKTADPDYYNLVDKKNPVRIQRAMEVILTTGTPYSKVISEPRAKRAFSATIVALDCERTMLRERINTRTDKMIAQGQVDEARSLTGLRHLNTLNTVGYEELFEYFDGTVSLADAITKIKNHTWQYAKKQITWLKRDSCVKWVERDNTSVIVSLARV